MGGLGERDDTVRAFWYYVPAVVSVIALVSYFSPWYGEPLTIPIIFYVLAFFWFLGAWIPMVAQGILSLVQGLRGKGSWKHHLLSAGIVALCYVGLFIGWWNGYLLTV